MTRRVSFLLFFVVLLGVGVAGGSFLQGDRTENVLIPRTFERESIKIELGVQDLLFELQVEPASTVHGAMIKAQEFGKLQFGGKDFPGLGFFVEEINGLSQDPRAGKYWIYYINGQKAEVGISAYKLKNNDVILWNHENEE